MEAARALSMSCEGRFFTYADRPLADNATLADCNVQRDSILHVTRQPAHHISDGESVPSSHTPQLPVCSDDASDTSAMTELPPLPDADDLQLPGSMEAGEAEERRVAGEAASQSAEDRWYFMGADHRHKNGFICMVSILVEFSCASPSRRGCVL